MKSAILFCMLSMTVCFADISVMVNDVTVMEGEDAVIPCTYNSGGIDLKNATLSSNETNPTKVWYAIQEGQADKRLYAWKAGDESETFKDAGVTRATLEIGENGELIFPSTTVIDNLEYSNLRCFVDFGEQGSESGNVEFVVTRLPTEPATTAISAYGDGEEGFIISSSKEVLGSCTSSLGYPTAEIKYYRNGEFLALAAAGGFFDPVDVTTGDDGISTKTTRSLVKAVEWQDHQAEFICSVITRYGDKVDIRNYTMPEFNVNFETNLVELKPDVANVYLGETITLKCEANGFPAPIVMIDGVERDSLVIEVTAETKDQQYVCEAGSVSATYTMEYSYLEEPAITAPEKVMLGENVQITCSASGSPEPSIAWYKGDSKVSDSAVLSFDDVEFEHSGEYICRAENGHDALKRYEMYNLNVRGMVLIGEEMEMVELEGTDNEVVKLECGVISVPKSMISWSVEDADAVDVNVENKYYSSIEVGPITSKMSENTFTCTAENEDGLVVTKTFKLPVIEEPSSPVAGIIIGILVVLLIVAIILAVLYNKGIICKKQEKGEESAEGDIAVEINNEDVDVEAGNGKPEEEPAPTEEEKLMNGEE